MKKVLVLASLGLLALSFSCGGDSATDEEKGEAGLAYASISSYMDFSGINPSSISINEEIPETSMDCNSGKVVTSGTATVEGEEKVVVDLTTDFQECSATDDVCNTGEEVIMNGAITTNAEIIIGEETADVSLDMTGTIDLSGVFTAACTLDLSYGGTFSDAPDPTDIEFNGTICGVNFEDIWNIDQTEIDALCAAVLAGGDAELASL